ncbi:hypothetical protein SAMN05428939_7696 [Streptomyces sp. TLI_105]|nr:hypothetical protein SAMN05428939_7696 [Streptomyces sp. TLI_105]
MFGRAAGSWLGEPVTSVVAGVRVGVSVVSVGPVRAGGEVGAGAGETGEALCGFGADGSVP